MATMIDRYDTALLGILQNCEKITNFMDVMFSFLYRRTDFYLMMEHEHDTKGFPPGVASKLAYTAYKKYEELATKAAEERKKLTEKASTVDQTESHGTAPEKDSSDVMRTDTRQTKDSKPTTDKASVRKKESTSGSIASLDQTKSQPSAQPSKMSDSGSKKSGDNSDDDDPDLTRMQKIYQENPESYNGAIRDNYSWSQQISDVDVRIQVPKYVKKGKCVKVGIQRKRLKAEYIDEEGQWTTVVDGELMWDVNKEESMWTLVPGEHIHVDMAKVQERWWEAVYVNEPQINVRKIDPSRPMTDLDDEAQAKIEEMMYNQRQKQMGLPQSHEKKVHNMLEKAWDAEGSPFRGQPFDPSQLNVQTGSM